MIRILSFMLLLAGSIPTYAQEPDEQISFEAIIQKIQQGICNDGRSRCNRITIESDGDAFAGKSIVIIQDPDDALGGTLEEYAVGNHVIVQTQSVNGEQQFFLSDRVRRPALLWLGILFAAAVFIFGGFSAMRSFAGLLASLFVFFFFIVPGILAGYSPLLIAYAGSAVIMLITFFLCHGWNKKTAAALGGTAGSLIVTAILATGFSAYAHVTGTADEEMLFLLSNYPDLNTKGILLAGIIIGTLGVLDDITVSQASAVFELRAANARLSLKDLYMRAKRIGADHIAAAINTLILAYAGTSLPLILLFAGEPAGESWWTFINRELIATEIIRTLVGSIGLLAAVPLTTFIASYLAVRTPIASISSGGHGHHSH